MSRIGLPLPSEAGRRFATTRWSLVRAAADGAGAGGREALETLCRLYWYPLYAHIRRRGHAVEAAQDLTQEFFARLLEKEWLRTADPQRGRFRSFLLAAADHFLSNQHDRARAEKRGGGRVVLSLDFGDAERRLATEPADPATPERAFERRWALTLLELVLQRLRDEYATPARAALFDRLQPYLAHGRGPASYRELATELAMTEGAVKVAIHRARQRFAALLRHEIAQTVTHPAEVDDEIRHLFTALAGG